MNDAVIGKEVDGYHVESVLGRGGMGVVYKAEDVALSRPVALKRINPAQAHREQFLRRFRSEAKALARINSPNITSIYALRDTDIGLLIVMEYVDGGTLKDWVEDGPMPPGEVIPIVRQILQAFRDAHGAGVIHRDIKPQNIMMSTDGAVKITDFGIAKLRRQDSGETVTQGGQGGTLKYMSPEQIEKIDEVDNRSDLYALGMTMYEMLAGRLPFEELDTDFDIMRKVVEGDVPSPETFVPNLPPELSKIIRKAIATKPEDRYASAEDMLRVLDAVAEELESTDPQPMWDVDSDDTAADTLSGDTAADDTAADDTAADDTAAGGDTASGDTESGDGTILDDSLLKEIDLPGDASRQKQSAEPRKEQEPQRSAPGRPAAKRQPASQRAPSQPASSPSASAQEGDGSGGVSLAVVGGIVVLVLAVATGAYFMFVPSSGPMLTLSTTPTGATVEINGDSVGTTPLSKYALEPGSYDVQVRKEGYVTLDTSLALGSGQALSVSSVQLRPRPVRLQVTSEPTGAEVTVGAMRIGETPIANAEVQAGRADVRIQKNGYAALDTTIQLEPGGDVLLTGIRLKEEPTRTAATSTAPAPRSTSDRATEPTVSFSVEAPSNVRVEIGDEVREGAGTFSVAVGTQTVRCIHPEHGEIETTVSASQNDTNSVSCVFQREVKVNTNGAWGNITVNGENTRNSTPHDLVLPPGRHEISVQLNRDTNMRVRGGFFRREVVSGDGDPIKDEFSSQSYQIDIEPGFQTYRQNLVFTIDS